MQIDELRIDHYLNRREQLRRTAVDLHGADGFEGLVAEARDWDDGCFVKDLNGVMLWANKALGRMLAMPKVVGKHYSSMPGTIQAISRSTDLAIRHGSPYVEVDCDCPAEDGNAMRLRTAKFPLQCRAEKLIVGVGVHIGRGIAQPIETRRADKLSELSQIEYRIVEFLARGLSCKAIAQQLDLSVKSVDSHKYRLMRKLEIHDRVELALYAIRNGVVAP